MSELLVKMAREAERDNKLLASHIHAYANRHNMGWAEIAHRLAITSAQLSRLALCRIPRRDGYAEDVARIAAYVGMEPTALTWFLQGAVSPSREGVRAAPRNGRSARRRKRNRSAHIKLGRLGVAVAFVALAALLGAFVLTGTRQASAATLVVGQGEATLTSHSRALLLIFRQTDTQVAGGGAIAVSAGDRVAVSPGGSATLRLSGGSTIELDGGTVIEVSELSTDGDSYRIRLDMLTGRTVSRVQRLLSAGDAFEIGTPSSTASVRGTVFVVEVIDDETTYVAVSEGTVWFEMDGETVELHEGDEITGQVGKPLSVETPTEEPTPIPTNAVLIESRQPSSTPTPTETPTETPTGEPEQTLEPTVEPAATEPPATEPPTLVPTDPPAVLGDIMDDVGDTQGDVGDTADGTSEDGGDTADDGDDQANQPNPPADPPADPPVDPPGNPPVDLSDGDGAPPGQQDGGGSSNNNSGGSSNSNNGGGNNKDK